MGKPALKKVARESNVALDEDKELTDYDSRFKRLSSCPGLVLINNYKCGFSSSNLLAHSEVESIDAEDTVILFYRNIFLRAMSVFINWCITDDRYVHQKDWLLGNLREKLDRSAYQWFLGLLHTNQVVGAFLFYVEALELIYEMDNHTLPQVGIFEYYGFNKIDYFVELENSSTFERLTNVRFPYQQNNRSNAEIKHVLTQCMKHSERVQKQLRRIYKKDIAYFADHGIDVASLRVLE